MSRRKWIVALLLVVVVWVVIASRLSTPTVPLRASRVLGTENTVNLSTPWRSSQEVLIYDGSQANLLNVETGARTPAGGFRNYGTIHTGLIRFSPDGNWLLWATGPEAKPMWAATEISTGRVILRPRLVQGSDVDYATFNWLPDSRHWSEQTVYQAKSCTVTYSVDSPHTSLSPPVSVFQTQTALSFSSPQMQASEHPLSPTGDRVAWFEKGGGHSTHWGYFLDSLIKLHRVPHYAIPRQTYSLWVSQSDGNQAHQVMPDFSGEVAPVCLNWTPDGKRLSFYYSSGSQNALWTVPAS